MNSFEHYLAGNLSDALETALSEVRNNPSAIQSRAFLAELMCFCNDFERADKQLNTVTSLEVKTSLTISTWRQLLMAAQIREDVFNRQGSPELIDEPTEQITQTLNNLISLNSNGNNADSSFVEQPIIEQTVTINGNSVDTWRDLDDLNAYTLEVLASNGKYFWVDFNQVAELSFHAPERPIDLLWRKASILLTSGSEGQVFIPTIYPTASDQDKFRLGRETDWQENNGVVRGIGLRTWLVGEETLSIMDIESITQETHSKTAVSA